MGISDKKLNILYVGTLPPAPGGSAISGSLLVVGFAKLGHRVQALAPITTEALRSGDAFAISYPEIRVKRYLVPEFETAPDLPATNEYRKLEGEQIREKLPGLIAYERPDIIMMGRETFAWHVPDIATTYSIPCILRTAGGTTLGILHGNYPEVLAQQLLEQYRKVDRIVTPAKHLAERMRQLGLNDIKVIPNAVDLDQFTPRPKDATILRDLAIQDGGIVVVHASNLKGLKRPMDVVRSAEKALPHNPQLVYVMVGDGPRRQSIETACAQRRISEQFRFVGWIDYSRMPDYINLADVVVMPAEYETMARVYLETQACARLLLASDIPGAREVIVDGETGLLFRMGDIEGLTAKTLLAASDPRLRAHIGREARRRVKAHSLDDAVVTYLATFEGVVRQRQG